jgi:hypothetical protein
MELACRVYITMKSGGKCETWVNSRSRAPVSFKLFHPLLAVTRKQTVMFQCHSVEVD